MNTQSNILNPYFKKNYPVIEYGKGIYMYTEDGREIIDATSGAVLVSLGHGQGEMGDILKEQADKITFAYRWDCITRVLEEASGHVCDSSGGDLSKVFFVCGGSEAVEISMKLARRYFLNLGRKDKFKLISRHQSYHGSTMGALSVTSFPARQSGYQDYLFDQGHIPPAYCYRCWYGKSCGTCGHECAYALEEEILKQGPDSVAAFILEPVSGMSLCGAHGDEEYFQIIRSICDKYEVLLIYDEVMDGIGRTGKMYAYQNFGVRPDIIALGKAISGGYFPVGAVACSQKVYAAIEANTGEFPPGYSWAGNPLGAAVVCKNFEILKRERLLEAVGKKGEYLKDKLREVADRHRIVGDVRGMGLMVGLEFVADKESGESFPPELKVSARFSKAALKENMFLETSTGCNHGTKGDMAMIAPAYIVTYEEIGEIVRRIECAIDQVEKQLGL
jgi:adenosylmethionine-8-amino-7-oxononanoate aminotransferase